jgi:hypothetical protein
MDDRAALSADVSRRNVLTISLNELGRFLYASNCRVRRVLFGDVLEPKSTWIVNLYIAIALSGSRSSGG